MYLIASHGAGGGEERCCVTAGPGVLSGQRNHDMPSSLIDAQLSYI